MLNRMFILSLAAVAWLSVSVSHAETGGKTVYIGASANSQFGGDMFKRFWNNGYAFGAGIGGMASPSLEIVGELNYRSFGLDEETFIVAAGYAFDGEFDPSDIPFTRISGGGISVFEATVSAKFHIPTREEERFDPYVLAGIGVAHVAFADVDYYYNRPGYGAYSGSLPIANAQTSIAISVGGGANFRVSSAMAIFADVRLTRAGTDGSFTDSSEELGATSYTPVQVGLAFDID